MQPGLSGNPFLLNLKFYLDGNRLQKRLRAEDGKAAQKILLKEIKINQQRNAYKNTVPAPRFETILI